MAEIINFNPRTDLVGFWKDCLDDYKAGNITDLVFVYRRKNGEERQVCWHWFGEESSILALGLIEYMKHVIHNWIREH